MRKRWSAELEVLLEILLTLVVAILITGGMFAVIDLLG